MPVIYQPPKFQQFEDKGNPKQHIEHFVETCNNASTNGDNMVKQFIHLLKGSAFKWYTDLEVDVETLEIYNILLQCSSLGELYLFIYFVSLFIIVTERPLTTLEGNLRKLELCFDSSQCEPFKRVIYSTIRRSQY